MKEFRIPATLGQEVTCREWRIRRELGRDEKGGEGGEEFMGLDTYALILD